MSKIGGVNMINGFHEIRTQKDLISIVRDIGFLPFFQSEIEGFSVDELTPIKVWEEYLGLGPWLWRDDIARDKQCIYGKFFAKKTGYISAEWFPHLANYRRDGYDFDARYDDGLVRYDDKRIYDIIEERGPISAPELRKKLRVDPKHASWFDSAMTRLQMMTYIVPVDFIFPRDINGNKKYSYGTTVFDIPERWLGEDLCVSEYDTEPKESFEIMVEHLIKKLEITDRKSIERLLK